MINIIHLTLRSNMIPTARARQLALSLTMMTMPVVQGCRTTAPEGGAALAAAKPSTAADPDIGSSPDLPNASKQGLKLVAYDSDGIEAHLTPADGSNQLPPQLQGIWWLDGNPQPGSVLLTLQQATYDSNEKAFRWRFTDPGNYSFVAGPDGLKDFSAGLTAGSGYKLSIADSGTEIRILARINILGTTIVLPRGISDFTATLAGDGHWVRHSKVFGITQADYDMRRIVDAHGQHVEPAYSNYLKTVGKRSYVVEKIAP